MKRAFTLIELVVVMACVSLIFGVAMVLFFKGFAFQRQYSEQAAIARSTDRFIEQFRSDARTFGRPDCRPEENVLLRWTDGDRQIGYELAAGSFPEKRNVIRLEKQGETVLATETFALPDDSRLTFVEGAGEFAGVLALSLWADLPGVGDVNLDELDPFGRDIPESLQNRLDPRFAGNWRTVLVRKGNSNDKQRLSVLLERK